MTRTAAAPWLDLGPLLPPTPDGRVRFTREAYRRMYETGVIGSDDRVELLDGEIVMMSPIGPDHASPVSELNERFVKCLQPELQCRVQLPIVVSDHSEPEPDLAIVRRRKDNYRHEHPQPDDVLLLIEVASSSLNKDLGVKLRIYAESKISEYWVIDVEHELLLVHREPSGSRYLSMASPKAGEEVAPLAAPQCRLTVGQLFE